MSKILSICTPIFNKLNFTKSYLKDLSKLPNDHEIIIYDNGSTDGSKEYLQNSKEIIYIRSEINEGFAKGSNSAYTISSAPNVLFLNNDIRVKTDDVWTLPLIERCKDGLVGPTMGQLDSQFNFIKESNSILDGNSYLSGWCIAGSKEIWKKLEISKNDLNNKITQIFSEEYFCYFEDADLGFRSKKLEIPLQVIDIPVVHFGKQSSSQLNTYYLYKTAKEIFVKKWSKNKLL